MPANSTTSVTFRHSTPVASDATLTPTPIQTPPNRNYLTDDEIVRFASTALGENATMTQVGTIADDIRTVQFSRQCVDAQTTFLRALTALRDRSLEQFATDTLTAAEGKALVLQARDQAYAELDRLGIGAFARLQIVMYGQKAS